MSEPTVAQVLALDPDKKEMEKTSDFKAVLSLIFFPPYGMLLIWRQKSLQWLFAIYNLLFGLSNILTSLLFYFGLDSLSSFYKSYGISFDRANLNWQFLLLLVVSGIQTFVSIKSYYWWKKNGRIQNTWLVFLTLLIVLNFVIFSFVLVTVLTGFITHDYSNEYKL